MARSDPRAVPLPQARRLLAEAEDLCAFLEGTLAAKPRGLVRQLLVRLTRLQHAAVEAHARAPRAEPTTSEMVAYREKDEQIRAMERAVSSAISAALGRRNAYYQGELDPREPGGDGPYSVSCDVADTYADLKSVLVCRSREDSVGDTEAAAALLEDYRLHWGYHVAGALRVLYWLDTH